MRRIAEEDTQVESFSSEKPCCQCVRQGVQKMWPQSRVRSGVPSTQMGQGSFSAVMVGGGVVIAFGVDGTESGSADVGVDGSAGAESVYGVEVGVDGGAEDGSDVKSNSVESNSSAASTIAACFSATFSASCVERRE